jgi:AhpC/TSA family
VILFLAAPLAAYDEPKPRVSSADRLAALQKEHKAAEAAYYKAAKALADTPDGRKKAETLWKEYDQGQADRFLAAVELATANPKSDVSFAALEWVLTIPRAYYLPAGKPAMELLTKHHAANPKIGKVVAWVGYLRPRQGESQAAATDLIEAVAENNPDRTARAQAVMARAWEAKSRFDEAEYKYSPDCDRLAAEADKAFEAVLKDYADCPRLMRDGRPLGEEAKQELFELRHLRIGKVGPDIEGEDLDGVEFKLSDYRGKVVVLDFWGDW